MSFLSEFLPRPKSAKPTGHLIKRIDWAGIGWLFLFFWYFSGFTQTLILLSDIAGFSGFRNAFCLSAVWLAPVLLFPGITRPFCALLGLFLWGSSLVSLGYFCIYHQEFSKSVIFILFETNTAEAGEYISQYLSLKVVGALGVYTLFAFWLYKCLRPVYLPPVYATFIFLLLLVSILGYPFLPALRGHQEPGASFKAMQERMEAAAPWQLVFGYLQYRQQLEDIEAFLARNADLAPLKNLTDKSGNEPRVFVLVIGESTTSARMSLYGYPRKTTPNLETLREKGHLIAFNNVIASRPYTIEMLEQALTFADQEHPDLYLTEPNLMNLMRQAGYKTFWITNQQTISQRNTLLTTFSRQADETHYLNHQRDQNSRQYDEVVLEPFAKTLEDPAPKKMIIVHLIGTHMSYRFRYPESYQRFTDRAGAPPGLTGEQLKVYNSYDNAVLYNDFVVSKLIEALRDKKTNGFMLYFSDHGEEVYDKPPRQILGRNESAPTPNMYAVPFLLWVSPGWQKKIPSPARLEKMADRKYSTSHLIHTWSDLAGLRFDRFSPSKSLINPDFEPTVRWIGDPHKKNALRDFDATVH